MIKRAHQSFLTFEGLGLPASAGLAPTGTVGVSSLPDTAAPQFPQKGAPGTSSAPQSRHLPDVGAGSEGGGGEGAGGGGGGGGDSEGRGGGSGGGGGGGGASDGGGGSEGGGPGGGGTELKPHPALPAAGRRPSRSSRSSP